ncbi:hypothetical protein DN586_19015 [Enterobacter cloacae]|uniref:Uncharacterized protein n=1 Tax=Enterobacter cloacae TaxID=550 RepID=A0A4Q2E1Q7_ENTCL|nr:hypothetical protein DN586_19015 [Enterobacter cloacae]RXW27020.1 hypothetical protein DM877_21545 [Enterobacter cloacae]
MPPASTYYPHKIELCCINVQFERVFLRGATQKIKAERVGLLLYAEERTRSGDAPLQPRFSQHDFQSASWFRHSGSPAAYG